jgi:nitrite reductase (NADH) large subunit
VRKVVCEDSLGIAAELEADMARVIGNYACEWKVAIEDPATLKRFRTFVNSDEKDRNVVFVEERGQIRPPARGAVDRRDAREGRRGWRHEQRTLA